MSLWDSIKSSLSSSAKTTINNTVNNASSSAKRSILSAFNNAKNDAEKAIKKAVETKSKTFKFDKIPETVEELKALPQADMKDAFGSVAMTVLALNMYYVDQKIGTEALDFVMGPGTPANIEISRINDSIRQNGKLVPLSYFEGATNENNYVPKTPYTIKVYEYATSKDIYDQGYYRLFVKSGGADSERQVTLRTKKSTGEWFAHEFSSLYMGIKTAKADDPWA